MRKRVTSSVKVPMKFPLTSYTSADDVTSISLGRGIDAKAYVRIKMEPATKMAPTGRIQPHLRRIFCMRERGSTFGRLLPVDLRLIEVLLRGRLEVPA
jgi:hypothetical protein